MDKNIKITFDGINLDQETYVMIPKDKWELVNDRSERGHYIFRHIEENVGIKQKPEDSL